MNSTVPHEIVYTSIGRGKIVWEFPDGTLAIEFDHGGGSIMHPDTVIRKPASKDKGHAENRQAGFHESLRR
jgi:hypothetical protein